MKHNWERHPYSETFRLPFRRVRVCANCGTQQEHVDHHLWMRVVGYSWEPKVGRCGRAPPNIIVKPDDLPP